MIRNNTNISDDELRKDKFEFNLQICLLINLWDRAITQAVIRRFPTAAAPGLIPSQIMWDL
jgi:hypothetical protein